MNTLIENPAVSAALTYTPSAAWPAWFQAEQEAAWQEFLATPAPTRKDEPWRYANLAAIDLAGFTAAPEIVSEGRLINASTGLGKNSARLVFGNNALLHAQTDTLPTGVLVKPLDAAARENEALFREYFMRQPVELGSHKYAQLHKALVAGGAFIHVPANTTVELPIELFHWVEGENASVFPHTLIVLGENARATVIDHFKSADGARALACGINDFHLAPGAQLTYVAVQEWSRDSLAFHLNSTIVDRSANSTALAINLGAAYTRGESLSRLVGEGARSVMLSINPMDGTRQVDQRTLQDHAAPGAFSDLLYHNSLDDSARTIFAGLIKVEPGAHRTDAYQKVRNLMLSDSAEVKATSMPGLEILADDVRCTHGATTNPIDEDELFYMQARGISEKAGRRLVVAGFFRSLLERVEDGTLRERLGALVDDKLGV